MVEAGEGVAVIPSYGQLACRDRKVVMSRLINPVVNLDFSQIRHAGRKLPPVAEEFTSFLQSYIATGRTLGSPLARMRAKVIREVGFGK